MKVTIDAQPAEAEETEKKYGKFDKWEIECAVDTLLRAEEIRADKEKMVYIAPMIKEKADKMMKAAKAVGSIEELKAVRQQKAMAEMEEEYED